MLFSFLPFFHSSFLPSCCANIKQERRAGSPAKGAGDGGGGKTRGGRGTDSSSLSIRWNGSPTSGEIRIGYTFVAATSGTTWLSSFHVRIGAGRRPIAPSSVIIHICEFPIGNRSFSSFSPNKRNTVPVVHLFATDVDCSTVTSYRSKSKESFDFINLLINR